jgi:hypothetical protein|tara:strand:+ start:354 stop:536 length:183 start_codon:yes stop_codon:yes gene_type:complete
MAKNPPEWKQDSFLDYFNDAATQLGYDSLPLAWGIASSNWKSKKDLNSFLDSLTNISEAN